MSFLILDLTSKRRETWLFWILNYFLFLSYPIPEFFIKGFHRKCGTGLRILIVLPVLLYPFLKLSPESGSLSYLRVIFSVCLNYIAKYFLGIFPTILLMDFLFCTNFIILPDIERKWLCIYLGFKIFKALSQLFIHFTFSLNSLILLLHCLWHKDDLIILCLLSGNTKTQRI